MSAEVVGIRGRIVQDHTGEPVVSAEVRIYPAGSSTLAAEAETDANGAFATAELPPGPYRIAVSKRGYVPARIDFHAGADPLAVRLVRYGAVAGRVTGPTGEPLTSALVFAMTRGPSGLLRAVTPAPGTNSRVDEAGAYRLYNLPPGEYAIAVSWGASPTAIGSTGAAPPATSLGSGLMLYPTNQRPRFLFVSGGEEHRGIDFTILTMALYSVRGKVEVAGAGTKFWVALAPVDQPAYAVAVVAAGEDGAFHVPGVASGSYHVFASGPVRGYGGRGAVLDEAPLFGRARLDVGGGDVGGVVVPVRKAVSAVVSLRGDEGSGCEAKGAVALTAMEDWAAAIDRKGPAGSGVGPLAPSRYQIRVSPAQPDCYQKSGAVLDLSETETGAAVVPIGKAGSIDGRVDGDAPASVVLLPAEAETMQVITPDSEGRFAFRGLPPGRYRIGVERLRAAKRWLPHLAQMTEVEVTSGGKTNVVLALPALAKP